MGLMAQLFGVGTAVRDVAEVFTPNATRAAELAANRQSAALGQFSSEFRHARTGVFDRLVDGLNRLPRPLMAFGTIGLIIHAMIDPPSFAVRMAGLATVPEPVWWLLGAIVSFYFGARELHYRREGFAPIFAAGAEQTGPRGQAGEPAPGDPRSALQASANAAIREWQDMHD